MRHERQKVLLQQVLETLAFFTVGLLLLFYGVQEFGNESALLSGKANRVPAEEASQSKSEAKRKYFTDRRSQVVDLGCLDRLPSSVNVNADFVRFRVRDCQKEITKSNHTVRWRRENLPNSELISFRNHENHVHSTEYFRLLPSDNAVHLEWAQSKSAKAPNEFRIGINN